MTAHRLGIRTHAAQSVFNWSDFPFRGSGLFRRRCSYDRHSPSTLFTVARSPPCQGCWAIQLRLSREALSSAVTPPVFPGETPHSNLCSRSVVTSTRGNMPFPSVGLSPFRPPPPSAPARASGGSLCVAFPVAATLVGHCWLSQPWVVKQLALLRPAAIESPPRRGWMVSHPVERVDVVGPPRSERSESLTPHVAARSFPRHPKVVYGGQLSLPHPPPRGWFQESEAPSTNRSHRCYPALAVRRLRGPPLVSLVNHQRPSFRHAFTPPPKGR